MVQVVQVVKRVMLLLWKVAEALHQMEQDSCHRGPQNIISKVLFGECEKSSGLNLQLFMEAIFDQPLSCG